MKNPSKYPPLFAGREDWQNNAVVGNYADSTYPKIMGYNKAADILVSYVEEYANSQDTLVYPIVFLYRHCLELQLKEIIYEGGVLLQIKGLQNENMEPPVIHRLDKLWLIAKDIVIKLTKNYRYNLNEDLDYTEYVIMQITKVDPNSLSFRYSKDKNKDALLSIDKINLKNCKEMINKVSGFLDGLLHIFDSDFQMYAEMQNDLL